MSSSPLLKFANETSILLAAEARLPREDVGAAFESIRAAEEGYEVMYTVTVVDDRHWRRVFLCDNANEATRVQEAFDEAHFDVYALRKQNDAKKFEPRRSTPLLVPSFSVVHRDYRVLTREEAAARAEGDSGALQSIETPTAPLEATAGSTAQDTTPQGNPATVKSVRTENKPPPPSDESFQSPQKNVQTLLKAPLSGKKHTRPADDAKSQTEAKSKKTRATSKKTGKREETTSLMKLARASAKNIGGVSSRTRVPTTNTTVACGSMPHNLLDEDEEKGDRRSNSSSSSSSRGSVHRNEEWMNEEPPTLDVTVSARANDDIILCDDAPPMVFCTPEPVAGTSKKEQQQKQQSQRQHESVGSATQPKLTGFFQRDVTEFQKKYMREVVTDTVFENGEYFCKDKVCFRHKETDEVISEEEFYRRSADIMRSLRSDSQNGGHRDHSGNGQGGSPAPAGNGKPVAVEVARGSRPPKVEKQLRSQPKTLFSYFKSIPS